MIDLDFTLLNTVPLATILIKLTDESGIEFSLETPLKISTDQWDEIKQRPINIYQKKYKKLNAKLDRLKIEVTESCARALNKKNKISISGLKQVVKRNCSSPDPSYPDGSLLRYIQTYISTREHLISASTLKRYIVFFRMLERFEGFQKKYLYLNDVNAEFIRDFLSFCSLEQYNKSTANRTIHFVRTILNFLEKRGIRTFVYELELPKEKKVNLFVTLDEDELQRIKKMDIPQCLKAAKDWLMISCYSGQRVSDFMNFNIQNMEIIKGKPCLSFVQQKTQKDILLPLHPIPLKILSTNSNIFPSKITIQKYNLQIKEVVRLAGINNLVKIRKRRGFRAVEMFVQKWEAVTSHIGRRSFASNFYGKIPTPLLMEATGHSTEQMFHRYISTIDTERTRSLGQYFEEVYKEKFLVA